MPEHSPSLAPIAVSTRAGDERNVAMSSFGITEDPEAVERKKRLMVFGAGVALFMAVAALVIGTGAREEHHAAAAAKPAEVAKPAEAPKPPPAVSALPAPKEEAKPAASAAPEPPKAEEKKPVKAAKKKRHH